MLNGDASLDVSHLLLPFNNFANHMQVAQQALHPNNAVVAPPMLSNSADLAVPPAATEPEVPGKKKRSKRAYKPRDPNAPKRPLTAYFRYLGEQRPTIAREIQENPTAFNATGKPGDISRVATERWNQMQTPDREPYHAAYRVALKEYERDMQRFKALAGIDPNTIDPADVLAAADPGAELASDDGAEFESLVDEDEQLVAPPPPPPAAKPAKKAAAKKSAAPIPAVAAPGFTSTNLSGVVPAAVPASSSPERKRKAGADAEGSTKKRGRKSGAEAVAASPVPVAATPVTAAADTDASAKKKKEKKTKKKGVEA